MIGLFIQVALITGHGDKRKLLNTLEHREGQVVEVANK